MPRRHHLLQRTGACDLPCEVEEGGKAVDVRALIRVDFCVVACCIFRIRVDFCVVTCCIFRVAMHASQIYFGTCA